MYGAGGGQNGWTFATMHEKGREQVADDAARRVGGRPSRVQRLFGWVLLAGTLVGWGLWELFV